MSTREPPNATIEDRTPAGTSIATPTRRSIADSIYALILLATALTQFDDREVVLGEAAWFIVGGATVLFIAHFVADALAAYATSAQSRTTGLARIAARRLEVPLVAVPFIAWLWVASWNAVAPPTAYRAGTAAAIVLVFAGSAWLVHTQGKTWWRALAAASLSSLLVVGVVVIGWAAG